MSNFLWYLSFPFVRYAFIVGVLIALCSSLLGVTLVLKRFSFIGDGLSHVAFGAIAIASVLDVSNRMIVVLPVTAFVVLNRHLFGDGGGEAKADRRTVTVCILSALVIGVYDGFYGPGTGTFLIIAFTVFAKMAVPAANAQAKVINLTTNITSLAVFLLNGQVVLLLGLAGAACNMAGNWFGSGLAITKGAKIVRPVILIVLALLLVKILTGF